MPFTYDFTASLKATLEKLYRKDRKRYEIVLKKAGLIARSDDLTIEHFKNLRNEMSDQKRVRIDKSFVLTFKVDRKNRHILFTDFDHHDNIYER